MILATLMIPTEMLVIPWYIMSSTYGWINSYWGIMFPGLMSAFGVFLIRQFMSGVPDELLDAGRIDGVTEFGLYWRIALPQIRPALAALCIFTFLGNWNAFLWPLIVIQGADMRTLPVGIALFSGEAGSSWNLIMASSALAGLPVLARLDRKSTRLNSSHGYISYAVFCLKKKKWFMQKDTFQHPISLYTPEMSRDT